MADYSLLIHSSKSRQISVCSTRRLIVQAAPTVTNPESTVATLVVPGFHDAGTYYACADHRVVGPLPSTSLVVLPPEKGVLCRAVLCLLVRMRPCGGVGGGVSLRVGVRHDVLAGQGACPRDRGYSDQANATHWLVSGALHW
jgi:hypothetical protein